MMSDIKSTLFSDIRNSYNEFQVHEHLFRFLPYLKVQNLKVYNCANIFLVYKLKALSSEDRQVTALMDLILAEMNAIKPQIGSFPDTFGEVSKFVVDHTKHWNGLFGAGPQAYDQELLQNLNLARSYLMMLSVYKDTPHGPKLRKLDDVCFDMLEACQTVENFLRKDNNGDWAAGLDSPPRPPPPPAPQLPAPTPQPVVPQPLPTTPRSPVLSPTQSENRVAPAPRPALPNMPPSPVVHDRFTYPAASPNFPQIDIRSCADFQAPVFASLFSLKQAIPAGEPIKSELFLINSNRLKPEPPKPAFEKIFANQMTVQNIRGFLNTLKEKHNQKRDPFNVYYNLKDLAHKLNLTSS